MRYWVVIGKSSLTGSTITFSRHWFKWSAKLNAWIVRNHPLIEDVRVRNV
jgi:hypothetical protein